MSRKTHGLHPFSLHLLVVFLLVCCLSAGCLTSAATDEQSDQPGVNVDAALLDFGESLESLNFTVTLTGGETEWSLGDPELPAWCTAAVERLKSGGRVTVRVDRAKLSSGTYQSSLTVTWSSGSHTINIRMVVPQEPNDTGTIIIDTQIPE